MAPQMAKRLGHTECVQAFKEHVEAVAAERRAAEASDTQAGDAGTPAAQADLLETAEDAAEPAWAASGDGGKRRRACDVHRGCLD